jgi:hypothetical protein
LIGGEIPAAVLTSVYPEAAEWFPEIAGVKIFRIPLAPRSLQARLEPAGNAAAKSDTPSAKIAVSSPMAAAAYPSSRTLRRDGARGARDGCKWAPRGAEGSEQCRSVWSYRSPPAQRHRTDSVRADKQHGRPGCPYDGASRDQIGVDLAGKGVAIEYQQSEAGTSIRIAIAAAGAVEVQLNQGHTKAIDRLIAGEVPAAILTLVSPEAAEWFPDITGYRIFRIPLSPIH